MSAQSEREAAARAWFAEPSASDNVVELMDVVRDRSGWFAGPGADYPTEVYALSAWLAWAKADAAKPAPVDALAGVVWEDADAVRRHAEQAVADGYGRVGHEAFGVDPLDGQIMDRVVSVHHVTDAQIVAHARAQLARESAPVAPEMTLDAMREALTAAGYEVVAPKVGGYERADLALTASQAMSALSAHDQFAIFKACFYDAVSGYDFDGESARLRALGVTPAVLK